VDEKTAIQAFLPLSPGRAKRHGFEYYRHGTLSLYAALNVKTGIGRRKNGAAAHQRGVHRIPARIGRQGEVGARDHIVLDNLSAHKTPAGEQFLAQHPKVRFHFTPTYCPG